MNKKLRVIKTRSKNSKSIKDDYGRKTVDLTNMNENYLPVSCVRPLLAHVSGQRNDLALNFEEATVIPINPDVPVVDSMLSQHMLSFSSCIKELRNGRIDMIKKISYQLRTVYIYRYNGEICVYDDNSGTIVSQKVANNLYTDLDYLNEGESLDLSDTSNDTFYLKYPAFFNPATGLMGSGKNIMTKLDLNLDNSEDSVAVSESFVKSFIARRSKTISLSLGSKKIISKYLDLFPPIGEILEEPLLFKLSSGEGDIFNLAQSSNVPSGEEDDTVVIDQTSMIVSIEVYCNNVIEDPILERYRQELLSFRREIFDTLNSLQLMGEKMSDGALKYLSNYGIEQFRSGHNTVDKPLLILRVDSLSIPSVGSKFTNRFGGKFTIQRIFKDGYIRDEFGRNVDLVYGTQGVINRMIPAAIIEVWLSALIEFMRVKYINNEVTLDKVKTFLEEFCLVGETIKEFHSLKLTDDEWDIAIRDMSFPSISMPVSKVWTLKECSKLRKLAKELFGYRQTLCGVSDTKYKEYHTVGYMYISRLSQDTAYQTSGTAYPEVDKRGMPKDSDDSKKKGLSRYKDKPSKHCVQTQHLLINLLPDEINFYFNTPSGDKHTIGKVKEHAVAIGMKINIGEESEEDTDDLL